MKYKGGEMTKKEPNLAKLEEMTHYLIYKCQGKKNFGKTVLFKLLYFSDFNYYKKNFESISNEQYKKLEFGPAPIHFQIVLKSLYDNGAIDYKEQKKDKEPFVFKSTKDPNLKILTKDEISTIDQVIKKLGHLNANEISKLSHEDNPYKSSKLNEIISYGLVLYRSKEVEDKVE